MPDGAPVEIRTSQQGDASMLRATGDVDMSGSPALREGLRQLLQAKPKRLIVDLGGVDYMDSSGVATLVEAMKNARASGTKLILCAMRPRVRGIFEIARLDKYFSIFETPDQALSS